MKKSVLCLIGLLFFSITQTSLASKVDRMSCDNEQTIAVAYPDTDHAILYHEGEFILLKNVISASGSRYTGEGWQWWTKGDEGTLAKLKDNEEIASDEGLLCTSVDQNHEEPKKTKTHISTPKNKIESKEENDLVKRYRQTKPYTYK